MPAALIKTDRRSQKTRLALRHALLSLMHERAWDDIGVKEICERADIGRSTFYTHFASKDALLVGGFEDLHAFLRRDAASSASTTGAAPRLGFALGLMKHGYENRTLFRTLTGRRSGHLVHRRFREAIIEMVEQDLVLAQDDMPRPAAVRWVAAGLFDLMAWWLEARSPMPVEDLHALFERMVEPIAAVPVRPKKR